MEKGNLIPNQPTPNLRVKHHKNHHPCINRLLTGSKYSMGSFPPIRRPSSDPYRSNYSVVALRKNHSIVAAILILSWV